MPRRPWNVQRAATNAATVEPVTSAETVVCTLPGITPDSQTPTVLLEGSCDVVQGATATTAVIRVRRGTTTAGTLVGSALTSAVAAAASIGLGITVNDSYEAEQASASYVMTIESPSATTNPKVSGACLAATY
jgi:hypothetical protein